MNWTWFVFAAWLIAAPFIAMSVGRAMAADRREQAGCQRFAREMSEAEFDALHAQQDFEQERNEAWSEWHADGAA